MTRFAWVLNLDADFELTRPSYSTPQRLRDDLAKHGSAARALLGPEDVIAEPGLAAAAGYVGRCWCPTPRALAQLSAAGVSPEPAPPLAVLRQVNHRLFSCELGLGLPGQQYVTTRAALDALRIDQEPSRMLKRPLSFAGRGQLRVSGALDDKQATWINKSLRDDGLVVEPLVRPTLEVSLHGFIWPDRRHQLGAACVQQVSERGVFRQARLAEPEALQVDEQAALFEAAERAAAALSSAGYFGPFGIDAYRYVSSWGAGFCALSEINARYTLGFAVGFTRPASSLIL